MEHNIQMNDLLEIFEDSVFTSDDTELKIRIMNIAQLYDRCGRHQYHMISRYVSNKSNSPDNIEYMLCNIQMTDMYIKSHKDELNKELSDNNINIGCTEILCKLEKLYDHIALEEERLKTNMKIMNESTDMARMKLTGEFSEISQQFRDKIQSLSEEQNANTITVIGLFSAIIFVFFGGLTGLSSVLKGLFKLHTKEDLYAPLLIIIILVLVILNLTFLLLYSISKIVGKNIGRCINKSLANWYHTACRDGNRDCYEVFSSKNEQWSIKCGSYKKMNRFCSRRNFIANLKCLIVNFFKVLFMRFPHITLSNILLVILSVYIYNKI